jgi:DNA modification methylase
VTDLPTDLTPLILEGHVLDVLAALPAESVQCVVTSPPYYSLRSYGTPPQVWGGDPTHAHEWGAEIPNGDDRRQDVGGNLGADVAGGGREAARAATRGSFCSCSAWRGELGLEPTLELYVSHLADVMDAVRRVLRPDGTLWLNLGDSYNAARNGGWPGGKGGMNEGRDLSKIYPDQSGANVPGLKAKDLMGMPWRVAFELQRRGWWLRSDVIWAKPNPMPDSTDDRPTRAHEYVFLLTKEARYFYDNDADRQPLAESSIARMAQGTFWTQEGGEKDYGLGTNENRSARRSLEDMAVRTGHVPPGEPAVAVPIEAFTGDAATETGRRKTAEAPGIGGMRQAPEPGEPGAFDVVPGANLRTVWEIPTRGFPEAHFATFPEALPERCIKLGTSERGACPKCGAPLRRIVARNVADPRPTSPDEEYAEASGGHSNSRSPSDFYDQALSTVRWTSGWERTCGCPVADPVPCIVLDPFAGSGTTLHVARGLGRRSIGIELNAEYVGIARRRSKAHTPSLESWGEAPT